MKKSSKPISSYDFPELGDDLRDFRKVVRCLIQVGFTPSAAEKLATIISEDPMWFSMQLWLLSYLDACRNAISNALPRKFKP